MKRRIFAGFWHGFAAVSALVSLFLAATPAEAASDGIDVLCIYYPEWHVYPEWEAYYGKGTTEWNCVTNARPRFQGHYQPIVPLMGYYDESDPAVAAKEIDLAADAGIDVFLYDWYWANNKPIQHEALENGFMKASNRSRMKFAIMWAYHDRDVPFQSAFGEEKKHYLWKIARTPEDFLAAFEYCAKTYFTDACYWRKAGHPFFSMYACESFVKDMGGPAKTRELLARAQAIAKALGLPKVHFNAMVYSADYSSASIEAGFDSTSVYSMHAYHYKKGEKMELNRQFVMEYADLMKAMTDVNAGLAKVSPMHIPLVSRGWDCTPRCDPKEPFPWRETHYPYMGIFADVTPEKFGSALKSAKEAALADPKKPGAILINAWNEYTEGSWLVPDTRDGDAYLRAIGNALGRKPSPPPKVSDATMLRMAQMSFEPVADDVITPAEQKASSVCYGFVSHDNGLMAKRYVVSHFGYTDKGFYLGVRTSVPEPPQMLTDDDRITLTLLPPGAKKPFSFVKRIGEGRRLKGIVEYGVLCAETEIFVPYSGSLPKPADGEKWGLNIAVDFSSERETATWHYNGSDREELGTLVADSAAPILSLYQYSLLESWRSTANYRFGYRVANNSANPVKMSSKSRIYRGVSFSKLNSDKEENLAKTTNEVHAFDRVTVAPGETKSLFHIEWSMWSGTVACFDMDVMADGATAFRRKISWDISRGKAWKAEGAPMIDVKYFPSYDDTITLRCYANGAKDLVNGSVELRGVKTGRTFWRKSIANGYGFTDFKETFSVPGLPEDDYEVTFSCEDVRGRKYMHVRTFQKRSFPWQGTAVGKERVIIPPFRPISVKGDEISFLQTGYKAGDNVLWDEIYGKGENLLAAPVALELNGEGFSVTGSRIVEKSPDRVVREVTAERAGVGLVVTQDYDYDGFCWVTMAFDAPQPVVVDSLRLTVPMKDGLVKYRAQLAHPGDVRAGPAPDVSVPRGEGVVWESFTNVASVSAWTKSRHDSQILPYLYIGGNFKGMAFVIESVRGLSVSWDRAPQRLVRKEGVLSYEFDLVAKRTTFLGKRVVELGFQPTPVKPRDPSHGKFAALMYSYACPSNAICAGYTTSLDLHHCNTPHASYYPNDDRSLLDYVRSASKMDSRGYKKRLSEYVERNRDWLEKSHVTSPEDYLDSKASGVRLMTGGVRPRYFDPMLITSFWPEWEMYKGEWYPEEWTHDNYYNEYMGNLCPSRIDKLMYEAKAALDTGDQGLYYDCFYGFASACFPQGAAYLKPNGGVQWSLSTIRLWREILKRSATLCYLQGKLYNGRPVVELHDTEGALPMLDGWVLTGLSTERGANGGEFPIRFNESFTLMNIVGGASGKGSRFIVSTKNGDAARQNRELMSLVGYMCAYGLFALEDQGLVAKNERFFKAWNIPFDYGWGEPEVEQFQYWNEEKKMPVTHTGRNIRASVGRKADSALVMFGNLGDAEECTFDLSGLGFGVNVKVTDAETGEPFAGNKLSIGRFGYRMLLVERR